MVVLMVGWGGLKSRATLASGHNHTTIKQTLKQHTLTHCFHLHAHCTQAYSTRRRAELFTANSGHPRRLNATTFSFFYLQQQQQQ